jgi:phosphate ABC transporter permease protein PstC
MTKNKLHKIRPVSVPDKKAEVRRNSLKIASAISSLFAIAALFMPNLFLLLGEYSVRMSGFVMLFANIRFDEFRLLVIPVGMRIVFVISVMLILSGIVLLFIKKELLAAGVFFAAFLAGTIESVFVSELLKDASQMNISPAGGSMQFGWMLFLLFAVLASGFSLAVSGLEKSAEMVFRLAATISVGAVGVLMIYMFVSGVPAIAEIGIPDFVFGSKWLPTAEEPQYGILFMILASLIGCTGAILIGVPIGLMTAVFLSEIAPTKIAKVLRLSVELLAGIPSVIYGFWGMKVLVPALRTFAVRLGYNSTGSGLAAVILILGIMILPTIIRVAETSLKSVPVAYTEAALALGNTKISTIFSVQIPAARSGILAGVILGVGRAIGETMAVIMVAGNIVQFPGLFSSIRPMTSGIAFEMGYAEAGLHRQALFAIGLVLFIFIMLVNITFSYISGKGVRADAK